MVGPRPSGLQRGNLAFVQVRARRCPAASSGPSRPGCPQIGTRLSASGLDVVDTPWASSSD